jgi:hypothetical protein
VVSQVSKSRPGAPSIQLSLAATFRGTFRFGRIMRFWNEIASMTIGANRLTAPGTRLIQVKAAFTDLLYCFGIEITVARFHVDHIVPLKLGWMYV